MALKRLRRMSPFYFALAYAFAATVTSLGAAAMEGHLLLDRFVTINTKTFVIHSFSTNYSTIIDFLFLNPVTIFFLQSSNLSMKLAFRRMRKHSIFSQYHRIGIIVVCVISAVTAMSFYFEGFLMGDFYDAVIAVDTSGLPVITITGWIVFFWTSLFIAFLFFRVAEQFSYTIFILSIRKNDVRYDPLHIDRSGGFMFLMEPSLRFIYAMMSMLFVFILFLLQDKIFFKVDESMRVLGFSVYIIISSPLFFLPLYHLHRLMKSKQNEVLSEMSQYLKPIFQHRSSFSSNMSNQIRIKEHFASLEMLEKYRQLVLFLPVWPIPLRTFIAPIGSIAGALIPIVQKLIAIHLELG